MTSYRHGGRHERSILLPALAGLLAGAVLAAGVLTADGAAAAEKRFDGVTLTVGTFGGSWKDRIHGYIGAKFEALGGEIQYVSGNPRILLSKLVAARGQAAPFDVVEIVDSTWPDTLKAGFVQKLNLDNIPNVKDLDANMYDEYKVANWMTEEGFIYDIEKFKELGIAKPTKFSDLLDPKLKGRVSFPDINVNTALNPIVGFAADNGGDENNIDPGLKAIKDLDAFAFWNSGTQITQMFQSGDIWVAIAHAGWGVRLNDAGIKVGMVHPQVKDKVGMASRGFAGVVKGTENTEAAEFYINLLVSEEMQEILHTKNGIVPTNSKVQVKYADQPKLDAEGAPFLLLSPEQIGNLYYMDWSNFNMSEWTKKWNRSVAQ
jgi:putative spermidine/putrescine transport system substrate-binding protein